MNFSTLMISIGPSRSSCASIFSLRVKQFCISWQTQLNLQAGIHLRSRLTQSPKNYFLSASTVLNSARNISERIRRLKCLCSRTCLGRQCWILLSSLTTKKTKILNAEFMNSSKLSSLCRRSQSLRKKKKYQRSWFDLRDTGTTLRSIT